MLRDVVILLFFLFSFEIFSLSLATTCGACIGTKKEAKITFYFGRAAFWLTL